MRRLTPRGPVLCALATVLAATVVTAGCSDPEPDATSSPSVTAGEPSTSSAGPTPSADVTTPATSGSAACSAATVADPPTAPNTVGLTTAASTTAQTLFEAAVACDSQQLIALATRDQTNLSFGLVTPAEAFVLPEQPDERYAALVRVLGTTPVSDTTSGRPLSVWPAVATLAGENDDAAWQEVVDAGLLTPAEAQKMRTDGSGYLGWRVGIDGTAGTWQFMVAGD